LAAGVMRGKAATARQRPRRVGRPGPAEQSRECGGRRDHPAICNLLLPWGFAMASGQLPHSVSRRARVRVHAGLLFAVPTGRTPAEARGSTRGKGALLRRQYSRRRYVVGRRWRGDDGRSDVCHISGTNLHRLANVADNLPPKRPTPIELPSNSPAGKAAPHSPSWAAPPRAAIILVPEAPR
jgi:hypothetical protein